MVNTFYFSGAQSQIYIGTNWMQEVVQIEGRYIYDAIPFYGYRSTHFDTVARGKVIASGSIMINYISDGYLYAHINAVTKDSKLNELIKKMDAPQKTSPSDTDGKRFYDLNDTDINNLIATYWEKDTNGGRGAASMGGTTQYVRPEFKTKPFDIKIADISAVNGVDRDVVQAALANSKVFKNCYLTGHETVRRADDTPIVEVYQFIGQSYI